MNENRSSLLLPDGKLTVISGGQTGVDRAALDAALRQRVPIAGWCPSGRRAEDGRIPRKYRLQETDSWNYTVRTEWNVRDSDGTLVIVMDAVSGGTKLTVKLARQHHKPLQIVRLRTQSAGENSPTLSVSAIVRWIASRKIRVLNVAGPRNNPDGRIYAEARRFCEQVFSALMAATAAI